MKSSPFSLYAQVLGLVDCRKFAELARTHGAERAAKGFGSWDQFVAMAFAPLAAARPHSPQGLQQGRLPGPLPSGFSARAATVSVSANPAAAKNRVSFMYSYPL